MLDTKAARKYTVSVMGRLTFTVERDVDGQLYLRDGWYTTGTNALSDEFAAEYETEGQFPNNYVMEEDLDILDGIWMLLPSEGKAEI